VIVVSNSGPPIYLAALSDFDLLPALFGEVLIPPAVWTEIVDQGGGFWLRVTPLRRSAAPIHLSGQSLHLGETEVIRLGEELAADVLLIDDRLAVLQARGQGFRVVPTVAIYIEAKRKGMIRSVGEKVDYLRAAGFRLTERDYRAVLGAAGEG